MTVKISNLTQFLKENTDYILYEQSVQINGFAPGSVDGRSSYKVVMAIFKWPVRTFNVCVDQVKLLI